MKRFAIAALLCALAASTAWAGPEDTIKAAVESTLGAGAKVEGVTKTPYLGLYEVRVGGEILYTDEKANYLILGEILDAKTRQNITQQRVNQLSGINFVSCPTESIHLQGRFDNYPKRRGVTRVAEIDRAGMNVCFGQDSIVDPWYPLGNGNILRILEAGLHICHMLGYEDLKRSLDLITDNSARALALGERYGLEVGRPANLLILSAPDDYEMVRSQGHALVSVRHGKVLMRRMPASIERA